MLALPICICPRVLGARFDGDRDGLLALATSTKLDEKQLRKAWSRWRAFNEAWVSVRNARADAVAAREARASNSALKKERDEFAGGCVELEASVEATTKKLQDAEDRFRAQTDAVVMRGPMGRAARALASA